MRWLTKRTTRLLAWAFFATPALAMAATPEQLCPGQWVTPGADGRVLGHIPYREAPYSDLVSAPAGFALGQPCYVQRDAAPDLARMLTAAAAAPGVGKVLRGVSCYRSIERQRGVFCSGIGPRKACKDAAERARSVGPPGHSEHSTGYAIDFGLRPGGGCRDVDPCLARTAAGLWLIAHAGEYGFELSFPLGNAQGVTWEPWHWRWVGASIGTPGAARARLLFARARSEFPASPQIRDVADGWIGAIRPAPPAPAPVLPPPGSPYLHGLPQSYFVQPLPTPTPTPLVRRRRR
jgi:D-alanyl-D-alanine carboxypeptidase